MFVTTLTVLTVTWLVVAEDSRVEQPSCEVLITKWTKWSSPGPGLAATIDLPVLSDIESWRIVLEFNKDFSKLNFFNAVSNTSEGSGFELSNESWSGKKKVGDHIKISLLGDYQDTEGSQPVTLNTIVLNGDVMCLAAQST